MNKGVVVEVKKEFAIVADKGQYTRIKLKEDMEVGLEIFYLEEDIVSGSSDKRWTNYRKLVPIIASLVLVMMMSVVFLQQDETVYTVVTVDINPSVELSLDIENKVIIADAMNADADLMDLESLLGLTAGEAVVKVIELAKDAGFILPENPAYVVVTTVEILENTQETDDVKIILEGKLKEVSAEEQISIAITESTEELLKEAEDTKVPLALLNFKDDIDINQVDSVKVFFESDETKRLLSENGILLEVEVEIEDGQVKVEIEIEDTIDDLSDDDDLQDLEELLFKLAQVPLEETEIHAFVLKAENALLENDVDIRSLKMEAKVFWESVKDVYEDIDDEDSSDDAFDADSNDDKDDIDDSEAEDGEEDDIDGSEEDDDEEDDIDDPKAEDDEEDDIENSEAEDDEEDDINDSEAEDDEEDDIDDPEVEDDEEDDIDDPEAEDDEEDDIDDPEADDDEEIE